MVLGLAPLFGFASASLRSTLLFGLAGTRPDARDDVLDLVLCAAGSNQFDAEGGHGRLDPFVETRLAPRQELRALVVSRLPLGGTEGLHFIEVGRLVLEEIRGVVVRHHGPRLSPRRSSC